MLGSYVRRTPFSGSTAMTADRACPPYAAAHHERHFDGNKRVSTKKTLIMSGFAGGRPFQSAENWLCFAFAHSATRSAKGVATLVAETLMTGALPTPEDESEPGTEESWSGLRNEPKPYLNGGQVRHYPAGSSCIAKRTREHETNCPEFNARRNEDFHRTQEASGRRLKLGLATTAAGYMVIENFPAQDVKIAKRTHETVQIRFERSKSMPQFVRKMSNPRSVHPKSEIRNPKSQALR